MLCHDQNAISILHHNFFSSYINSKSSHANGVADKAQALLWAWLYFLTHLFSFSLPGSFYCSLFAAEFIVESWASYPSCLYKQRICWLHWGNLYLISQKPRTLWKHDYYYLVVIFIFLIYVISFIEILPVSLGTGKSRELLLHSSHWLLTTVCEKQIKTLYTDRKEEAQDWVWLHPNARLSSSMVLFLVLSRAFGGRECPGILRSRILEFNSH